MTFMQKTLNALKAMVLVAVFCSAARADVLPTPLEAAGYSRLSTSTEISTYLENLVARAPTLARKDVLGRSVQEIGRASCRERV